MSFKPFDIIAIEMYDTDAVNMSECSEIKIIHTYHSRFIPEEQQSHFKYSCVTLTFYHSPMRNTINVTGKHIVVYFLYCP
jgi:hypothetical protein